MTEDEMTLELVNALDRAMFEAIIGSPPPAPITMEELNEFIKTDEAR